MNNNDKNYIQIMDNSFISFSSYLNYQTQYDANQKFSENQPDDAFIEAVENNNRSEFTYPFEFTMGAKTVTASIGSITYSSHYRDADGYWWGTYPNGGTYSKSIDVNNNNNLIEIKDMLTGTADKKSLFNDTNNEGGNIRVAYSIDGGKAGNLYMDISISSQAAVNSKNDPDYVNKMINSINDAVKGIYSLDIISNNSLSRVASTGCSYVYSSNNEFNAPIYEAKQSLMIQAGSLEGQGINISYDCLRDYTLGIENLDISTYEGSQKAIGDVANALSIVSQQRSTFGAYQNRLEHVYNIDQNTGENLQAAESKMRDTDMAKEMVEFSKNNILQQCAQSMMMQANQIPQHVMDLLS